MEPRLPLETTTTTSLDDLSYNSDGALAPTGDYNIISIDPSHNLDGALPSVRDYNKSGYSLI